MLLNRQNSDAVFVWFTRGLLGLLVYLAMEMRADIKELTKQMPVAQEQIRMIQEDISRLKNKVFASHWPAKKEEEINLQNLLNLKE
jgi:hypothetical protein